jgi:hypothetical protein
VRGGGAAHTVGIAPATRDKLLPRLDEDLADVLYGGPPEILVADDPTPPPSPRKPCGSPAR